MLGRPPSVISMSESRKRRRAQSCAPSIATWRRGDGHDLVSMERSQSSTPLNCLSHTTCSNAALLWGAEGSVAQQDMQERDPQRTDKNSRLCQWQSLSSGARSRSPRIKANNDGIDSRGLAGQRNPDSAQRLYSSLPVSFEEQGQGHAALFRHGNETCHGMDREKLSEGAAICAQTTIPQVLRVPSPGYSGSGVLHRCQLPGTASKYDLIKVRVLLSDEMGPSSPPPSYVLSRFMVSRWLMAARVSEHHAVRIALDVKKRLVDRGRDVITQRQLEHELFYLLQRRQYGESTVGLYRMLTQWYQRRRPLLVVIAGTKGLGKAALATQLAERLHVSSVIKTEVLAELVRGIVYTKKQAGTRDHAPSQSTTNLWEREFSSVSKFLDAFKEECAMVHQGLAQELHKCFQEGKPMIVEGPHLDIEFLVHVRTRLGRHISSSSDENSLSFPSCSSKAQANGSMALMVPFLVTLADQELHRSLIADWMPGGGDDLFEKVCVVNSYLQAPTRGSVQEESAAPSFHQIALEGDHLEAILDAMHAQVLRDMAQCQGYKEHGSDPGK